jgi:hypothetical protein
MLILRSALRGELDHDLTAQGYHPGGIPVAQTPLRELAWWNTPRALPLLIADFVIHSAAGGERTSSVLAGEAHHFVCSG